MNPAQVSDSFLVFDFFPEINQFALSYLWHLPGRACYVCQAHLYVRRAQPLVTERAGGYNILKSWWTAPYFSLGTARVIQLVVLLPNPSGASAYLSF